jgi:hypothetical protein
MVTLYGLTCDERVYIILGATTAWNKTFAQPLEERNSSNTVIIGAIPTVTVTIDTIIVKLFFVSLGA